MLKIGWFSTGRGEGSRGLLQFVQERILRGDLDAKLEFVFSNRAPGEAEGSDQFFQLVHKHGLPLLTSSSAQFRRERGGRWSRLREEYDRRVMALLQNYRPDICVLAGYMLIVGGEMCRRYPLLNLHPALPDGPIGTWQEVIWELMRQRATRTGAMIHLATVEVDRGPVIAHCTVPIVGEPFDTCWRELDALDLDRVREDQGEEFPLFQLIRQAGFRKEPYLILETLRAVSQGRVLLRANEVLDGAGRPLSEGLPQGLCLDAEIERAMRQG
jgi:folate-dependent phosphoribosylglycinamide formyltransferase PurN